MTKNYSDVYYTSGDGLKLYARNYPKTNPSSDPSTDKTVLCLHGFTRNSADFSEVCEVLRKNYHVIVPDQRGRGLSEYDENFNNYNVKVYAHDMFALLDELAVSEVRIIGTSMGGVIGMTMAGLQPKMVPALVLNDVGPELDSEGLQRLLDYLGHVPSLGSWGEAVAYAKQLNAAAYPKYSDAQWEKFSENLYVENDDGTFRLAYDSCVASPYKGINALDAKIVVWPLFAAISATKCFIIRGELSDILSLSVLAKIREYEHVVGAVEINDVGHAPMLDEPAALSAIQKFLAEN